MSMSLHACCRHYPGGTLEPLSFTGLDSGFATRRRRPSPSRRRVGFRIKVFEAFPAFTVVTAYMLAEPLIRPFPSRASAVWLPARLSRLLPGRDFHPLDSNTLFTAHDANL